jgi:translation initiation factor 2 beta subunit (eIF-2beta)/eIF-5
MTDTTTENTGTYFAEYPEDFEPYDRTFLLDRAEDLFAKKSKTVLPNLAYEKLNRKTYIRNVEAIAEKLNRTSEDLRAYFSTELRVPASIKEDGSLKLDRIFYPNNLNPVYKNFIKSVQCDGCRSVHTKEVKENRITFLECLDCHRKVSK